MNNSAAPVPVTMEPVDPIHWYDCGHGQFKAGHTIDVKRNTVKIEPNQQDTKKYRLTFTYNAQVAGSITVCFFYHSVDQEKKEVLIDKQLVKKGPVQKFIQEGDGVEFPLLRKGLKELYKLEIVARVAEDGSKNCILEKTEAVVQNKSGITKVKVKNQFLFVNGRISACVEAGSSTQKDKNVCRICFDKENPGIVFPIEKLQLSEIEIAKGSNGNRVYKGTYDGLSVVVKRIPKAHSHDTDKVIQILKESDPDHRNIVRFIAKKKTEDFVFIVYESCDCTLHDLISSVDNLNESGEYRPKLTGFEHLKLWKPDNNSPSEYYLKLMRCMLEGIAHFDEVGIIPNLDPRRIFICKGPSGLTAKVLGLGIRTKEQTTVGDSFDLWRLLCFCITAGYLPFDHEDVQAQLKCIPEAHHLISRLRNTNSESRPTAKQVLNHPFFWDPETRLSFFRDSSNIAELEEDSTDCDLDIQELLMNMKGYNRWSKGLDDTLVEYLKGRKRFVFNSIRGLIRGIRNIFCHDGDLSPELKSLFGEYPTGLDAFFRGKFPGLLMDVYKVMKQYRVKGWFLQKYYGEYQF